MHLYLPSAISNERNAKRWLISFDCCVSEVSESWCFSISRLVLGNITVELWNLRKSNNCRDICTESKGRGRREVRNLLICFDQNVFRSMRHLTMRPDFLKPRLNIRLKNNMFIDNAVISSHLWELKQPPRRRQRQRQYSIARASCFL